MVQICYVIYVVRIQWQSKDKKINVFTKHAYFTYCRVKLGDLDKPWAPHKVHRTCVEGIRYWKSGKKISMPFGIPIGISGSLIWSKTLMELLFNPCGQFR